MFLVQHFLGVYAYLHFLSKYFVLSIDNTEFIARIFLMYNC